MSKTLAKRQIGISRTGNRKHPADFTLNEIGMGHGVDRAAAIALRDLARERRTREKSFAAADAVSGGALGDDHGDIDPMMFE